MNIANLELMLLIPAFLVGVLILITHVPLGMQVLQRGIIFIDLAIAQIAGLGVIVADLLGFEPQGIGVQVSAIIAALLGSVWLTYSEKRWPEVQEALIGVLFVMAATGGILLLAHNPHGGEHLKNLLVGQILWVSYGHLPVVAVITAVIALLWFRFRSRLGRVGFYILFAGAVTTSVQLIGVYLVFASLIIPAMATRNYPVRTRLIAAYLLGIVAYALGLLLSAWIDYPTGAVIVWMLVLVGVLFYYFGPTLNNENQAVHGAMQ
jgi:zinc/manganese transport system permease protein